MLRPLRESMAIVSGTDTIPQLFTGTFVGMLMLTPVFGWISSRFPRKVFLPWVYYLFIATSLLFYVAFSFSPPGSSEERFFARFFFVWISVFNLFVVSVFWSFMADIFSQEQSRRLFGVISAGGSAGAMLGPFATSQLVSVFPYQNIFPISALLLCLAIYCIHRLTKWADSVRAPNTIDSKTSEPIGGSVFEGIRTLLTRRYFMAIAVALGLANFLGGVQYKYMAELVKDNYTTTASQTQFFANMDLTINIASFVIQLFLVRFVIARLGVGWTLTALPVVSVLAFGALFLYPSLAVLATVQIIRRSIGFGFTKPTTDMLYAVVTTEEKYKAKNFIETTVYRGWDVVAAWAVKQLGFLGIHGISLICVVMAAGWSMLTFWVGREYQNLGQKKETVSPKP